MLPNETPRQRRFAIYAANFRLKYKSFKQGRNRRFKFAIRAFNFRMKYKLMK